MPPTLPQIPARFTLLIAGLCRVVAAHIAADREAGPWIVRVWNHLQRIARHVELLAAQVRAGTVPQPRAGWTLTKPRQPVPRPPIVLAGKPAWLIHRVQQTAVYGGYLRQLLDDPEMAALLAAAPQLARVLRPLCRALGVAPPPLPPRPAPAEPAPPEPAAARAPRPQPPRPEPGSLPCPRRAPATAGPRLKPA